MVFALPQAKRDKYDTDWFLRQFGSHSLSYHTLQAELSHFETEYGYIAYIDYQNETIALGDPVAKQSSYKKLIELFLEFRPHCSFIQVSQTVTDILSELTFSISYFGVESEISLPYQLHGKEKKEVRLLSNSAIRNNIKIKEIFDRSEIINLHYCNDSSHEYAFLSRPCNQHKEKDVRIFAGYYNDMLVGYSLFDPMYQSNKIIGYAEVITRQVKLAPKGTRTFILLEAMKQFEAENIPLLNLGLLPFYQAEKQCPYPRQNCNHIVELIFSSLYNVSPLVSNFEGLSFHKSRYRGTYLPRYFATNSKRPYKSLLCMYKLTTGYWIPWGKF